MTVSKETLRQLPSPPFITVDGIANVRDVGGYSTRPAGSIRRGVLFRSANPMQVTPSGLQTLKSIGLRKVFDLRSEPEVLKGSVAEGRSDFSSLDADAPPSPFHTVDGPASGTTMSGGSQLSCNNPSDEDDRIERVWVPVFKSVDYTSTATFDRYRPWAHLSTSEAIANGYMDIFTSGAPAYRTVLEHLASPDPSPCLIHCTAGKDRTGGLAALVLLLCGVDRETIAKEYALTKQGLGPVLDQYKDRFMDLFDMPDKERIIDIVLSADAESMMATIEMLDTKFGGAEAYVKHVVGLDDSKIAALRRNMITQQRAVL